MNALPAEVVARTTAVIDLVRRAAEDGVALEAEARESLALQRRLLPDVARFLDAADVGADAPWWQHAVPTALFRRTALFAGPAGAVEQTFESSGTTDPQHRSRAPFSAVGLQLMEASVHANAERMLFPDDLKTRVLVLAPPPAAAPAMIMAWGMQRLIDRWGLPGSGFLIGEQGLDPRDVVARLQQAIAEAAPVTLIGASFGFVHLLDGFAEASLRLELPPGSRTMDAGGFKGRSREVRPAQLRAAIHEHLGVPEDHAVNLLGMTELASQLYDDVLAAAHEGRSAAPAKINAPWTATVVLDPDTLDPAPHGKVGVLAHLDLANVERPAAIRTSDLGRATADGFEVLGRAEGSDSRGCSISIDELAATR